MGCAFVFTRAIPTQQMDKDIRVLQVTAPPEHPNVLTVGRIFLQFTSLEEVSYDGSSAAHGMRLERVLGL